MHVKNIAGCIATTAVLGYAYLGQCACLPENESLTRTRAVSMPAEYSHSPYYKLSDQNDISDQIETIHNFVSELLENSQDSDPIFSKTIDEHFWDLV